MNNSTEKLRGPITLQENARSYLEEAKIPEMFKSLLAALMVERPSNPLEYLNLKLEEIKSQGMENIDWEYFIHELHPSRDPVRKQMVQVSTATSDMPQYDVYKPQIFQLTEHDD